MTSFRLSLLLAFACGGPVLADPLAVDLRTTTLSNPMAYIPPQCYTKTQDAAGVVHNPCFTCNVESRAPHHINDADLQTE